MAAFLGRFLVALGASAVCIASCTFPDYTGFGPTGPDGTSTGSSGAAGGGTGGRVDASSDVTPATCFDQAKNGDESDVDCGGTVCPRCPIDKGCVTKNDCAEGVCTNGTCVTPGCGDHVKNGDETDVDCGGSCPIRCATGKKCGSNGDCQDGVCTAGSCQSPTCADATKNEGEVDVDCGGPCQACAIGKSCVEGKDCATGVCSNIPPTPKGDAGIDASAGPDSSIIGSGPAGALGGGGATGGTDASLPKMCQPATCS